MADQPAVLTLHPDNPRYFVHPRTGRPIVLMGDFGLQGDLDWLPQRLSFDAESMRAGVRRAAKEWNANVARLWHFTPWELPNGGLMPWKRVEDCGPANDGFGKFDLDLWDERYWSNLRDAVRVAADEDLIVQAMIFDRCGVARMPSDRRERWYLNPYNPDNNVNEIPRLPRGNTDARRDNAFYDLSNERLLHYQSAYVERFVAELAPFWNVMFEICNEYCDEDFNPGPADWEEYWIRFVRARCDSIVFVNNLGRNTDPPGTPDRYWESDLRDMISWHTIWPHEAFDRFVRFYDKGVALCHGEQAFDWADNTATPRMMTARELRMVAWGAFLGGGHLVWDEPNPTHPDDPLRATRELARFLDETRFDFIRARPDPARVRDGWCMASPGRECVVYLPEGGDAVIELSDFTAPVAMWFDPETGTSVAADAPERAGSGWFRFPARSDNDAVVHVRNRGA